MIDRTGTANSVGMEPEGRNAPKSPDPLDIAGVVEELEGCVIRRPGHTCEVRKDLLTALLSAFKARGGALERLASSAEDVRQMLDRDITRQGPEFRALGIPFVAAIARARALSPTVKG